MPRRLEARVLVQCRHYSSACAQVPARPPATASHNHHPLIHLPAVTASAPACRASATRLSVHHSGTMQASLSVRTGEKRAGGSLASLYGVCGQLGPSHLACTPAPFRSRPALPDRKTDGESRRFSCRRAQGWCQEVPTPLPPLAAPVNHAPLLCPHLDPLVHCSGQLVNDWRLSRPQATPCCRSRWHDPRHRQRRPMQQRPQRQHPQQQQQQSPALPRESCVG